MKEETYDGKKSETLKGEDAGKDDGLKQRTMDGRKESHWGQMQKKKKAKESKRKKVGMKEKRQITQGRTERLREIAGL